MSFAIFHFFVTLPQAYKPNWLEILALQSLMVIDGCYPAIYQDRFYLEEDELARQLVEIGCRKGEAPAGIDVDIGCMKSRRSKLHK